MNYPALAFAAHGRSGLAGIVIGCVRSEHAHVSAIGGKAFVKDRRRNQRAGMVKTEGWNFARGYRGEISHAYADQIFVKGFILRTLTPILTIAVTAPARKH